MTTMPSSMAILSIRRLSDETHARLRVRAATNGRSMEAEARAILDEACGGGDERRPEEGPLREWVDRLYGDAKPRNTAQQLIDERRSEARSE